MVETKIKIYRTNYNLDQYQWVYLIKYNKSDLDDVKDFLVIACKNIQSGSAYKVGTIHRLGEDDVIFDDEYDIKNSPLYDTFLFNYFVDNCEMVELVEVQEKTIPVSLGMIKEICGWTKYCDVTGANHYMLKEYTVSDRELFDVKRSHAKELGLIK